jgi:predicted DNA-binding transcriptional regulator AlpA
MTHKPTATSRDLQIGLAEGIGRDHGVRASLRDQYGSSSHPVPVPTEIEARRALGATYDLAVKADRPALLAAFFDGWHQARRLVGYPVGIPEVAEKLGVKRATVDQWIQRGLLPEPDWTVGGRPAWNWPTVWRWAEETGRAPQPD